jgi:hypothetical protein
MAWRKLTNAEIAMLIGTRINVESSARVLGSLWP